MLSTSPKDMLSIASLIHIVRNLDNINTWTNKVNFLGDESGKKVDEPYLVEFFEKYI